jgi:hypothetical protein
VAGERTEEEEEEEEEENRGVHCVNRESIEIPHGEQTNQTMSRGGRGNV